MDDDLARMRHDAALAAEYGIDPPISRLLPYLCHTMQVCGITIAYDADTDCLILVDDADNAIQIMGDDFATLAYHLGSLANARSTILS